MQHQLNLFKQLQKSIVNELMTKFKAMFVCLSICLFLRVTSIQCLVVTKLKDIEMVTCRTVPTFQIGWYFY